ncbi:putative bifunctional diguanylate cyclase/phosphodiesterase [Sphingomonas xinjiangensis]|uniref:EAL domain-containing protein (Putative c-di-GMP-specific phosphodiesterase class I)/GGDEF domain-containing protein n=1 Tax=Sphingomonas xinjiangensis TaxID=643568 RepID=A0A840YCK7_9SPHN|nr:EAL domain-containing protein [Sphingomonas xinjiangensis]MBB5710584.1 EAL domain-containing protein (putative c-di-GMP-specific phosphodiesterase class I)/GGDEF domain-containing protein [Sphingomonas xinjiangensis]
MSPFNEEARLDALYRLSLLDTSSSESFDRITRMASQIFGLPIAAISLTDRDRQWFKSRVGIDHRSIPREKAPCGEVAETSSVLLIPDLHACPNYGDSLLAEQGVRYYAGAPLVTREGHSLGALCVLGTEPRETSHEEISALTDLARMVMDQIELQHAFGRIDPLSGLPNRNQFLEDLNDLGRDHPGEQRLAVLLDLARNDQLSNGMRVMGSGFMDDIVRDTACTITKVIGPGRTAYHVAATQFAFLAPPDVEQPSYCELLANLLAHHSGTSRARFVMTSTIGIAPFVVGRASPSSVLRRAHSAAQDARLSSSLVSAYSPNMDETHRRRFRLLNDFGTALDSGTQLSLEYQPRINLRSGACVGVEALLRWNHPALGPISPAEFIPIIEQTALAGPTTSWVLNTALHQLHAWHAGGIDIQMAVNVSAHNLQQADFAAQVQRQLLKHRVPASALELEVTESAMMDNVDAALSQISMLNAAGIVIAIDDFGTGYSSLTYLQRLPARVLKIDRSFVQDMLASPRERALVASMLSLAHDLEYRVVAEGIETEEVRQALSDLNCDEGQGYLFARPMRADAFLAWHLARNGALSQAA